MKIGEAKKKGYHLFQGTAPERAANLKQARYLEYLAANARVNINGWDLSDFLDDKGNMVDRATINRLFFEKSKDNRITQTASRINDEIRAAIRTISHASLEQTRQNLRSHIEMYVHQAEAYDNARVQQLQAALESQSSLDALTKSPPDYGKQFEEILSEGFYEYYRFHRNNQTFEFLTPEVTLTHRNNQAGVDMVVMMGRYRVVLHMREPNLRVWVHENNLNSNGYIHPFFSNGAWPCYGSAKRAANQALANRNYKELLRLTQQLLTTYSHEGGPYRSLDTFYAMQEQARERAANDAQRREQGLPTVEEERRQRQQEQERRLARQMQQQMASVWETTTTVTMPGGWN